MYKLTYRNSGMFLHPIKPLEKYFNSKLAMNIYILFQWFCWGICDIKIESHQGRRNGVL